jgi:hypothetical protein
MIAAFGHKLEDEPSLSEFRPRQNAMSSRQSRAIVILPVTD